MSGYAFAVVTCVLVVAFIVALLRSRRIKEKYAVIWMIVAVSIALLAIFPGIAQWLATLVGVQTPINLLFIVAFIVLLAVAIQLSTEVSRLEEEVRTLAEEIALIRQEIGSGSAGHSSSDNGTQKAP